ncbi:hypothetical protein N7470_005622 [Penicillium chermesinum]|nr:hypothetical protein N7470_005622 [Penicillium chermesinum]
MATGGSCDLDMLLMEHSFGSSYGAPFVGNYQPPGCDFDTVRINLTVTSRGRQFDRLALMYLGDSEVFRTSTAEPTASGIIWTYIKEMSQYIALWKKPQKLIFDLGNIISDVYTGPFNVTLTAHFSSENTATLADIILPISAQRANSNAASAFTLPNDNATSLHTIPAEVSRAVVSISACGQAQEEFWWSNVFTEDTEDFTGTVGELYGYSPFREVQLYIDGTLAGVVWPFPVIFTGGVAPGFWRPIVGIDAFDLRQPEIDISPFLPILQDGKDHSFEIRVTGLNLSEDGRATLSETVNSNWVVTGNIFLFTETSTSPTVASESIAPRVEAPAPEFKITRNLVQNKTGGNETLAYSVIAERTFSSKSSQYSWSQSLKFSNYGFLNQDGYSQVNRQLTSGTNVIIKLGENPSSNETTFEYPLVVNATYGIGVNVTSIDAWMQRGLEIHSTGGSSISTFSLAAGPSKLMTTQSGKAHYKSVVGENSTSSGSTSDHFQSTMNGIGYSRAVKAVNGVVVDDTEGAGKVQDQSQISNGLDGLGRDSPQLLSHYSPHLSTRMRQTEMSPPTKRRKVGRNGPFSLSDTVGLTSAGIPVGYIPLARLSLRMNFQSTTAALSDHKYSFPVLIEFTTIEDVDRGCSIHKINLKTVDAESKPFFHQTFDNSRAEIFEHLKYTNGLPSAHRYSNREPTACYQAVLSSTGGSFCLEVAILWKNSSNIPDFNHVHDSVLEVFGKYALGGQAKADSQSTIREKLLGDPTHWSPREFYKSVHVPPNTESASAEIVCPELACKLFPFQRRAVRWLLWREGMELRPDGKVVPVSRVQEGVLPASFKQMRDANGQVCYFSHLYLTITTDLAPWDDAAHYLKGGILAEEMGLGKTVEIITLMNLNRRPVEVKPDPDGLRASKATLIITPPAILEQWRQEIQQHAPHLQVHHYEGIKRGQEDSDHLTIEELAEYDVVLTTYNVIAREIHYSGVNPGRALRHEKRFAPRKTPLVRISWWRVCLDEAQMVESGVSNAAKVARLIPRQNAWAVTGTPLRRDIDDIFGLLLFLHYQPFCHSNATWKRLYSRFGSVLAHIIKAITLRHSKDQVRDELKLPLQKRVVITTPFTAIEEQHYGQLFEEMCDQCGLNAEGAPLHEDWDPEDPAIVERMRTWLTRLRQTCLHPEVSGLNRRVLGANNGPLRTVDEVLEVMMDNTDAAIRNEERSLLLSQLRRGQILENAKRRKESLAIWEAALKHSTQLVEDSRAQLLMHKNMLKGTRNTTPETAESDDEESDKNNRVGQWRIRLRSALEIQHIAVFFTANGYYQIKSDPQLTQPDSEEFKALEKKEEEGYEAAKIIRKELLSDISRKVEQYMQRIKDMVRDKKFVQIPKMKPHIYSRGIESRGLLNRFEDLCEALNKHAEKYIEWRDIMTKLVSQSLIDQEEDAQLEGDEYERSTKHQDEMYVYMEALRTMYADRHDALTGQTNVLISHEIKAGLVQAQKGEGPSPQLYISVVNTRDSLLPPSGVSLRGIVSELRSKATALEWDASEGKSWARAELEVVSQVLKNAGQMIADQLKVSSQLEKEVEIFRDTMNNRLEYYRHLQQISDTVAPYDEENAGKPMDEELFATKLKQEEGMEHKISSLKSKKRYLLHLRDDANSDENSRICIICQSSFEVGVLTVCGHKYCTDCLRLWWRQHRTCPMCKKPLKHNDFHQITYKPQKMIAQEEEPMVKSDSDYEKHSRNAIYSDISTGLLNEIKTIDLDGSFGTKIDTLARHIIWLREVRPGAKSIVFSQYKNFLAVLQRAFHRFKITSSSVDTMGGIEKFKKDPSVECFLLHVWMYLVSGTVEESIYELSVARRLAHIMEKEKQKNNAAAEPLIEDLTETAIDSANSMEMQDAPLTRLMTSGVSGGEMVKKDDLWQCLFGNAARKNEADLVDAEREVGRFLRGEAAETRRDGVGPTD